MTTNETIVQNNKLIAKFMGEKLPYKNKQGNWEYMVEGAGFINSPNIEDLNRFLGFNYHSDWNRLMEVVEKIKSIVSLMEIPYTNELIAGLITVNKEAVYNACVEFIKWHEQNK